MPVFRLSMAALAILCLPLPAAADEHEDALMQEVAEIGDALTEAMLANDVEAMLAVYADDAISLPNYQPRMQGLEAFRAHHAQMAASGMKINSFDSQPTEVWAAGDYVIEIGTFTIELDMPPMTGIEDRGKYMTVWVRDEDGDLKVKAETWNTDMNPMEMMGGGHGETMDDAHEAMADDG